MRFELMVLLCRAVVDAELEPLSTLTDVEWRQLLALASREQVLTTLARQLDREGYFDRVEPAAAATLQQALRNTTRFNLQCRAHALKLAGSCNAIGIEPLFLKGTAALLRSADVDFAERELLDIDVLLAPEALAETAAMLLRQGYRFSCDPEPDTAQQALAQSRFHRHLPPLAHENYGAVVELHRHPLPIWFAARLSTTSILDGSRLIKLDDTALRVPGPEAELILLVLGKFVHDGYRAGFDIPLRALFDYRRLLERHPGLDRDAVAAVCGPALDLFEAMATAITGVQMEGAALPEGAQAWLRGVHRRYDSPRWAFWYQGRARIAYLLRVARHTPGKFLQRF